MMTQYQQPGVQETVETAQHRQNVSASGESIAVTTRLPKTSTLKKRAVENTPSDSTNYWSLFGFLLKGWIGPQTGHQLTPEGTESGRGLPLNQPVGTG